MSGLEVAAQARWLLSSLGRYPRYALRLIRRPREVVLHGVRLALGDTATAAFTRTLYAERYERGEARCLLRRLASDDVVLEIGAGLGFLATLCAQRIGSERVTACEANPALLPLLRETFARNGVAPALVHGVVSDRAGSAELFVTPEFTGSSTHARPGATPIAVPRLAVNGLLRERRPTLLVVDVEGGESELLPAIDWTGIRKLVLELHPDVIGAARCRELVTGLESHGLREVRALSSARKKYFERR
jgi:FkbM family methyltransferase